MTRKAVAAHGPPLARTIADSTALSRGLVRLQPPPTMAYFQPTELATYVGR